MEEVAYAKLNLALHVRARTSDGYHDIETLFAFAQDGDLLSVEAADRLSLAVTGPFGEAIDTGLDNLVVKAAMALRSRFGIGKGGAITLDKRLPVAAGIGGGSADAAAALRLLSRFWAIDASEEVLREVAAPLGADVPACVLSRTARGEGRGDRLRPVTGDLADRPLLLVNPRVPVSTAAVFKAWGGGDLGPLADADPLDAALAGRNDLQPPAMAIAPVIGEVLHRLEATGATLVRMSGSGATCFAVYDDAGARDAAARGIAAARPDWWTLSSCLR